MNAIVEPVVIPPGIHAPVLPAADPAVREGILEIPGEMALHHGGRLSGVRLAWRMVGRANAPVVCALGGISANRRVCLGEESRHAGSSETGHRDREQNAGSETRRRQSERQYRSRGNGGEEHPPHGTKNCCLRDAHNDR